MCQTIRLIDNTLGYLAARNADSQKIVSLIEKYADIPSDPWSDRIVYRDDEGRLDPHSTYAIIKNLLEKMGADKKLRLEFCANDLCGMATANTLAAIKAGVCLVHTSVGGIVPNGGAAMEEVLLCMKFFLGKPVDTEYLAGDCEMVLAAAGKEVPPNKAVIGKDIFAHESGIHVDGVLKNPLLYEVIRPDEVGLQRKLIIGKHSGRKAVFDKLSGWGLSVKEGSYEWLTPQIKSLANMQKHALNDAQLRGLYFQSRVQRG